MKLFDRLKSSSNKREKSNNESTIAEEADNRDNSNNNDNSSSSMNKKSNNDEVSLLVESADEETLTEILVLTDGSFISCSSAIGTMDLQGLESKTSTIKHWSAHGQLLTTFGKENHAGVKSMVWFRQDLTFISFDHHSIKVWCSDG